MRRVGHLFRKSCIGIWYLDEIILCAAYGTERLFSLVLFLQRCLTGLIYIFRAAVEDSCSDDMFGPTQNIESDPSTQSPNLMTKYLSGDSTKIDSPGSFQRLQNILTMEISTPSFNHEFFNNELSNHELFNHGLFNYELWP